MNIFDWRILLAHSHWVTFAVGKRQLRVCARCLGVTFGFLGFLAVTQTLKFSFFLTLPLLYQISFCLILAFPAIFDWVTQTWKLRDTSNVIRIVTGFFEGGGAFFLSMTSIPLTQKIFLILFIGFTALNIGFLNSTLRIFAKSKKVGY